MLGTDRLTPTQHGSRGRTFAREPAPNCGCPRFPLLPDLSLSGRMPLTPAAAHPEARREQAEEALLYRSVHRREPARRCEWAKPRSLFGRRAAQLKFVGPTARGRLLVPACHAGGGPGRGFLRWRDRGRLHAPRWRRGSGTPHTADTCLPRDQEPACAQCDLEPLPGRSALSRRVRAASASRRETLSRQALLHVLHRDRKEVGGTRRIDEWSALARVPQPLGFPPRPGAFPMAPSGGGVWCRTPPAEDAASSAAQVGKCGCGVVCGSGRGAECPLAQPWSLSNPGDARRT